MYASTKGMARELNIPIWTVSQVNRAGAKDDVIEGDKAAGSYNKMMIADFALSLSRKRQDKVNGTGRIHIMKNRYGMDGMTFGAKINTNNGHIELTEDLPVHDDIPAPTPSKPALLDTMDKKELSKKFLELSKFS